MVTLNNCTVSGNSASAYGGGIYTAGITFASVILYSSLISGNTANYGNEVVKGTNTIIADSFNFFGHSGESNSEAFDGFTPGTSDFTATSDGTDPTVLVAILGPLADYGGPTWTHALVKGSPAVDLDVACGTGLTTDQRGEPRPDGAGCDAGAFEGAITHNGFLSAVYLLLL
jgi:predicted outer membrane repeat protein